MSTPTTLNGVSYAIPATGDGAWGTVVSNYLIAISTGTLTKAGGTFTLTAEVNFGATYGIKAPYLKSQGTNPSGTGVLRLANLQAVAWRNAANNADLPLIATAADRLSFAGVVVPTISSTDTFTNKTIDTATNVITNLRDANIASDAAISYGKLALTGQITGTDLAAASIPYSKLVLTGAVVNADISLTAAIAYSKLSLTNSIVDGDVSPTAAISYSKLALTGAVVAADLAGSIPYSKLVLSGAVTDTDLAGGISYSKLVLTNSVVAGDLVGSIPYGKLILTGAVTNADLASAVSIAKGGTGQTTANAALNALLPAQATFAGFVLTTDGTNTTWTNPSGLTNPMTSVGDIIVGGTLGAATRLAVGASGTVLKGGTTPSYSQIVDADVSASAALSYSKLALTGAVTNNDLAGSIAYSKLVLTGAVTNNDLAGSIAYSKLVLTGAVTNSDLAGSIALTKLANQTAGSVIIGNASAVPTATALTGDVTVSSSGVTAIGSAKVTNAMLAGSIAYSNLAALTAGNIVLGNASNVATSTAVTGDVTISSSGVTAIGSGVIVDADVNASAAIAGSKIQAANSTTNAGVVSTGAQTFGGVKTFASAPVLPSFSTINSATNTSNSLITYQEGAWTPVPTPGSGAVSAVSFTGRYTRVGRLVTATCGGSFTKNTGSGTFWIAGLPCTSASGLEQPISLGYFGSGGGVLADKQILGFVGAADSVVVFRPTADSGAGTQLTMSDFGAGTVFINFTVTYSV